MFTSTGFDFTTKFKDPSAYPQNLILRLERDYFSSADGDIEQSGVEFDEYFTTATDLQYGETPASAIRFTLINKNQLMRSVKWGECKAYIGYNSETHDATLGEGTNAQIEVNGHTLSARSDGFYIGNAKVYDGECYSILAIGNNYYAFGNGYTVMTSDDGSTFTNVDASRFMINKMRTPKAIVVVEHSDGVMVTYVNDGTFEKEWVYVPMGVYYLAKPKGLNDFTVSVTDAIDRMRLFDTDASEFYKHMTETYPSDPTIKQWFDELIAWTGVQTGYTASGITTYNYNPSNAGTLRELLNFLAEKFRGNFRFDRVGKLQLYRYWETVVEDITPYNIEESSLEVAEYSTRAVDKIVVKNLAGLTYIIGSGNNIYSIYGNPFVQDGSGLALANYAFYPYVPVSCIVLESNPCVDVGDKVNVYLSDEEYKIFVDAYNRMYTNENGALFTEANTPLAIPLMHRTLVWNGVCTATYEATGNEVREIPSELEQINYNANTANDTENVINKIVAHGIVADWIKTGLLKSLNGKFYLDMETGTVVMANAQITGGGVNVETTGEEDAVVRAFYYGENDGEYYKTESTVAPFGVSSDTTYYSDAARTNKTFRSWVNGISEAEGDLVVGFQRYGSSPVSGSISILAGASDINITFTYNDVDRVYIGTNGIEFYDANGNLTKSYPAT